MKGNGLLLMVLLVQLISYSVSYWHAGGAVLRQSRNNLSMKSGGHGQGFRYLPTERGGRKYHFPRIIQIAGVYPDLSPEELLAPTSNPAPAVGTWAYDFSDPEGPQLGVIALPGSDVITGCEDPVVIITTNIALGLSYPEEVEMVACIDRGNRELVSDCFFAFRTPDNRVQIQWSDSLEPGYEILGKVVMCLVPFLASMSKPATGFAEEDEEEDE